ncbi:hypothetical protein PVK06_012692 [Gossypium arboreum]|uniref:Uncharacterized protein n=1 Tax=Gossypium arboreum TaxID=29729 RepID=A0ABR0QD84_GOSAR|nr:hypothetical protein PVK06_012692 [Gossypium arboreum]
MAIMEGKDGNIESDEYTKDPFLTTRVGILEDGMFSCQATMSSMSNTFEQLLEVVQHQAKMSALIEEVEHDIPELEDEGHYIVIEHKELNMDVQQELEVGDRNKVVRNEEDVFTSIDIKVRVRVEIDVEEELNLELSASVKEPTHLPIIVVEKLTKVLHDYIFL